MYIRLKIRELYVFRVFLFVCGDHFGLIEDLHTKDAEGIVDNSIQKKEPYDDGHDL